MTQNHWQKLIQEMETGSERALGRLITRIENRENGWLGAMKQIYPKTGNALVVGITGAPGAGKSTLTNGLAPRLCEKGFKIGIVAVDPSSPFSGGALLGDRLRMREAGATEGMFVRSLATRGALGGLSLAARDVVKLMDAFGKDLILVETVGVGQDEIEIVKTADIVLVVCMPGMGDGIQAIKAGIMEIADIFVVNKADHDGADQTVSDIRAMLDLCSETSASAVPIYKTKAHAGEGLDILVNELGRKCRCPSKGDGWQEKQIRTEIVGLLEKEVTRHLRLHTENNGWLEAAVRQVIIGEKDPYSIVEEMTGRLLNSRNFDS